MTRLPPQTLPDPLPQDPLQTAAHWLQQAYDESVAPNPNAMTLATVGPDGQPSARIVLCKDIVLPEGYVLFFSNYQSRKGAELAARPRAATIFHWDVLHRQVRIEGLIVPSPVAESDEYFESRAWQSRIGAWASHQSQPVDSRSALLESVKAVARQYAGDSVRDDHQLLDDLAARPKIPRPPHWGGYRLWADTVELWVEGEYRIHDRARWTRRLTAVGSPGHFHATPWHATRLQP